MLHKLFVYHSGNLKKPLMNYIINSTTSISINYKIKSLYYLKLLTVCLGLGKTLFFFVTSMPKQYFVIAPVFISFLSD